LPQFSAQDNPKTDDPLKVDLAIVARDLKLPPEKIEKTVELLDAGNTIPFITRFRKDLTGSLNEQQILAIKQRVTQLRALAERKSFVLKSIESQGKLTDELKTQINKSSTSRRLEDLYLPFKPKKQSRASLARQQGLEPLAEDIFSGASPDIDLATRSTEFVRVDKGLTSVDDVIKGVGDLLAERFSENDEVRDSLRKIMWNEGKLESQLIVATDSGGESSAEPTAKKETASSDQTAIKKNTAEKVTLSKTATLPAAEQSTASDVAPLVKQQETKQQENENPDGDSTSVPAEPQAESSAQAAPAETVSTAEQPVSDQSTIQPATELKQPNESGGPAEPEAAVAVESVVTSEAVAASATATVEPVASPPATKPKKKKKKKKKKVDDPFSDYRDFKQPLKQIPNHRILAINRGERAGKLKVKIKVDGEKLTQAAFTALIPPEHPSSEFLKNALMMH